MLAGGSKGGSLGAAGRRALIQKPPSACAPGRGSLGYPTTFLKNCFCFGMD